MVGIKKLKIEERGTGTGKGNGIGRAAMINHLAVGTKKKEYRS